ncbi:MAG: A/G-specific adenine glycosylase [Gammaproteobacteria bacterium]|nr:A/G-specific adenine glycosylase [Gammaproteobacteria bacterium]NNJ51210.1 A/G-specific adenine glycosylase [Gammaproteobacteria bacterium]
MTAFADRLLDWYRQYGRHDLPWQIEPSLYRSWVSEVMLQQTQVATVIPYFEKFIQLFPDIAALAEAPQDEVMRYWAGLGYYSRCRNLHSAAGVIAEQHGAEFPRSYDEVLALPGIGPSTAGAILAQVLGQRHAILDGNVKRVLARYRAIEGWPGQSSVEKQLWSWAEKYTPEQDVAEYTQAIMDLGAMVCTRTSAKCDVCPLMGDCMAFSAGRVAELPSRKPKKALPVKAKRFLIIRNQQGHYLMEKRPPSGIWGGLWSLPELGMDQLVDQAVEKTWQLIVNDYNDLKVFRHTFSHFHLDITPCEVSVAPAASAVAEPPQYQWCSDISQLALAAPVTVILQS